MSVPLVMDWAGGATAHEGLHRAGCRDVIDADPIRLDSEVVRLVSEDLRHVFPCAAREVERVLGELANRA